MDLDDLEPKNKPKPLKNLEIMSVEALDDYIQELEAEIRRTQLAIERKKNALSDAEAAFKR